MVEAIANSVEDRLIDGLSFKLNPGASYVTDRRSVTFHPTGSNIYKPKSGTKTIKFNITGDSWMDPSTFRFSFSLRNTDETGDRSLRPVGGPWGFFRRMRISCGGIWVEDIDQYNRIHEMFQLLQSKGSRENDGAEAFGYTGSSLRFQQPSADDAPGICPGQSQTVMCKLLSGVINQGKMLPIRYMPMVIELELVDHFFKTPSSAISLMLILNREIMLII